MSFENNKQEVNCRMKGFKCIMHFKYGRTFSKDDEMSENFRTD